MPKFQINRVNYYLIMGEDMSKWVLILGGSTGHGAATAKRLAKDGYGIIAFHFDRGEAKKLAAETIEEVNKTTGGRCHYFNTNAASEENMNKYIPKIKEITGGQPLKLLLHSIAFGTTTNLFGEKPVTQRQMDMTIHVMGNALLYWTQNLYAEDLLANGSRVMGLTSEGNYVAMEGYGPVSVAKVAMEAIIRQIGWELGQYGITANSIQAGVTPTRALTKITDDWEKWIDNTKKRNPMRRTTTPEDVAGTISMLLQPEADFINCSIIYCDGGESRSGSF
ncbi:MAG: SDR family oxidoreductase [Candidatus Marinimicrobia bacterium]|jgi:enoyl-[acyl-carrier-protein] reductase (NADH)|nr:SDR family oxidoreductase [Candidatus Neomarinimicrobiota bacterium]MBT3838393.1 SDR family oxidoreductase [Candidatus Neomarinimicrobiota bacterium]MBT3998698.1 SDR family oxidoreductase [Candidatus Neomarinimicrobiota bacterium]MBT4283277.1 SDR family oxidoreductase [Candidatus Neomarinimicrobiota bacterium]MBT4578410.1 SDR family oxidoreductase [Candidatus Neomarinimicrobiota bacterium]